MTTACAMGTLYGVGVGPGAADLLTLRAVAVLGKADAILAAASPSNDHSIALEVARPHLRPEIPIVRLDFPMTRDREKLETAWKVSVSRTLDVLGTGRNAAFLTLGDPLLYSTFGYLMRLVRETAPHTPIEIIPGITSFQAAAARSATVLCEGEGSLRILSGIRRQETLIRELGEEGAAVILKTYRNYPAVLQALERTGRMGTAIVASRVEQPGESIAPCSTLRATPPYMTLVISPAAEGSRVTDAPSPQNDPAPPRPGQESCSGRE
jgi:precorrin-2/cobalt-factor-2 C20-methyltransferase